VDPTTTRKIVDGLITNAVSGATGAVPFFEYFKAGATGATSEVQITMASGAVPTTELGAISHLRVNYRVLAESGNDSSKRNAGTLDDRTATFNSDIYFRTNPSICG
jgi:hypothetical protein